MSGLVTYQEYITSYLHVDVAYIVVERIAESGNTIKNSSEFHALIALMSVIYLNRQSQL